MINGNIEGLSKQILQRLDSIYEMSVEREDFLSEEMVLLLCELTGTINREISVYLNRRGEVMDVSVGDQTQVSLSDMSLRRSNVRLSGIRCIHTHPGGSGLLSGVDLNSLIALRFDAMTAIGVQDGSYVNSYTAFLTPPGDPDPYIIYGPFTLKALCGEELMREIRRLDPLISMPQTVDTMQDEEERAILVGLDDRGEGIRSVNELEELAKTAGAVVLHKTTQNRKMPEPATYIGRGKAAELALQCQSMNANLVICDDELSAVQIKNLESTLGVKVIDRTTLILDIFSRHAVSREGKLQVELAQLKYRLPRLTGMGHALSRLGGGIGTRGPGEKKLETDRRHIHRRINEIESELARVKERRSALRSKREREGLLICALAGYTNSGKSTLLNALSGSNVLVEDKLFATLDPVSRGITLADGQKVLLIDTVGFIDKLPHDLVQAFHSTLEEVAEADLLLHVVDASSPNLSEQMMVVKRVLNQLGAKQRMITVYNKMDLAGDSVLLPVEKPQACVSALYGEGLDILLDLIRENLPRKTRLVKLVIPYEQGSVRSMLHEEGKILNEEFAAEGVHIEAEVDEALYGKVRNFLHIV
ncbi:MAG: GTPase HflX [Caldicoprobacterales bacterium]|jgi:GTP-binding protein HflX|nr:GTPase HflX [Clostridiales bacterium]